MKTLLPLLILCLFTVSLMAQPDADVPSKQRDQVFLDDVIVDGSICVGFDCVNGESFGFDTQRLKENNLRIRFDDTSTSASFPKNDWQITINDTSNGGAEKFSIDDISGGKTPFTIRAGARTNSLFVASSGRVGFGTSSPVADLHVKTGNTPTLRLEQDGTSGFTPQTWDLAGNEANLFVRDATSGSTLPFRIFPGAPTNALTVEGSTGDVGIGTTSPTRPIHVLRTNATAAMLLENTNAGAAQLRMETTNTNRRIVASNGTTVQSQIGMEDGDVAFYGANTAVFSRLEVGMTALTGSSSRALKNDIQKLEIPNLLDRIAEVPVTTYNWKAEHVGSEVARKEIVGLIAQDFYTVLGRGKDTEINGQHVQMALWMGVQELHINNQQLKEEVEEKEIRISELEDKVTELTGRLDEIADLLKSSQQDILLNGGSRAILGQNYPNPYNQETAIEYFVPEKGVISAEIHFTDNAGKLIKKVNIETLGKGKLNLKVNELPQGNYNYTLLIDGSIIDTKQMILNK